MNRLSLRGRWSADDFSRVARIAWPTIVESIMVMLVTYVDTAMVGQLGKDATAAVAINSAPSWMLTGACAAVQVGATVLVAQSIGAGDREGARRVARQAMTLGMLMGLVFMILLQSIGGMMPGWLRAEAHIVPVAAQYIRTVSLAYIPYFTGLVLSGILRGSGDTTTPMKITMFTNVINVIGNFFLIYPSRTVSLFGMEIGIWGAGMGVLGAAIPTAVATALSGVLMFIKLARGKGEIRLELHKSYVPQWHIVKHMLRIGMPAALGRICVNAGHMVFQTLSLIHI